MEKLYRLDLSYVGTSFCGWQTQPNGMTVQEKIEKSLTTALRHPVRLTGASRTDSGVHAEHQVATFRSSSQFDSYKLLRSVNALVGLDVAIHSIEHVSDDFHPIACSIGKVYRYQIWNMPYLNPFYQDRCWFYPGPLDVNSLKEVFSGFIGTHDFTSFAASDGSSKTFERTIRWVEVVSSGGLVTLRLEGDGFLKQMVRNLVGTTVDLSLKRLELQSISEILAGKSRQLAGLTAPAEGLYLEQVLFP